MATTVMMLTVDLKCSCCYKKVRKLLCKFPQIRDQMFDLDKNKVMITVVCCDPEKMRDKLCCEGGNAIQSIEIPEPEPSSMSQPESRKIPYHVLPPQSEPVKMLEPPVDRSSPPGSLCFQECNEGQGGGPRHSPVRKCDSPKPNHEKVPTDCFRPPGSLCCQECNEGRGGGPCHSPMRKSNPPKLKPAEEAPKDPLRLRVSVCCQDCYEGGGRGPCHCGYGRSVALPAGPCYEGYGYGNRPPCRASMCDYLSEENPQGCLIM